MSKCFKFIFILVPLLISEAFSVGFIPGQRLISIDRNLEKDFLKQVYERGIAYRKLRTEQNIYLLDFQKMKISETQIDEYLGRFRLLVSEKNFVYKVESNPDDVDFSLQWGLKNIGINPPIINGVAGVDIDLIDAWRYSIGNPDLLITVLDTGVDYRHEDLKDNIWVNTLEKNGSKGVDDDGNGYVDDIYGYNFVDNNGDPMDGNSHGTHCAGVIGATSNNGIGISGILKEVSILAVKFLGDNGSGSTADAIEGIAYATKMNSDIISNSWGGGGFSQLLEDEIIHASDKGIFFIAAAGNDGENNDKGSYYPADYEVENIIVVASHDASGKLASSSNYGLNDVDVAAPGVKIYSTLPNNKYGYKSGTSMATPHVSAAIGLLLDYSGKMSFSDLKKRLSDTIIPVPSYLSKISSAGRLNIKNLLQEVKVEVNRPDEFSWHEYFLVDPFESTHPYLNNENLERTIHIPGAKFLRVEISRLELEENFDYLMFYDVDNNFIEQLSGSLKNHISLVIAGDTLRMHLLSDFTKTDWGVKVEKVQWQ